MKDDKANKLSTEPYKGVRDFYPEDMFIQNYLFDTMRKTVESFGYAEYSASILEPTELYKAKSGEEIVNDQTYSFKDRGDRDVTLRPEMTPTITRMIAARKRELSFPLRWYSIPNLFRYEKPQRGRLREHYQLNVDLFGVEGIAGEIEVISVAHALMRKFGADETMFVIKINNRKTLSYLLDYIFKLNEKESLMMMKLLDKKNKIWPEEFKDGVQKILNDEKKTASFLSIIHAKDLETFSEAAIKETSSDILGLSDLKKLFEELKKLGIMNVVFDPTIVRGFDYYTGIVFEVNDTNSKNPRSLFGGGRYDDLLSVFGSEKVPAVGFGAGDVTIADFLETHNILPKYTSRTDIYICTLSEKVQDYSLKLAHNIRECGLNVSLDSTYRKISDQIKTADKQKIPYIIVIGEDEVKSQEMKLKELATGTETTFKTTEELAGFVKNKK